MSELTKDAVLAVLEKVIDPEIGRPITELDMVREIEINGSRVDVKIDLTIAGCPMKTKIRADVEEKISSLPGVEEVIIEFGAMTEAQREALKEKLHGPSHQITFNQPGSLTRIYAITSGKGGVGKSSMTANLALALSAQGLKVGVVDADIYGFSIPRMLGVDDQPNVVEGMIMPPQSGGVKVISIGMFVPDGQAVVWRGPMLHRALNQFLADVYWGDLDVLLLDLPPGTGDVALSVAQLLPGSEILVVTTPQVAAAEVAERTGTLGEQTDQRVVGVIENMSYLEQPDGSRLELFGAGGGQIVSERLSEHLGYQVPLLAQVPLDIRLREGSDSGAPVVATHPDSPAAQAISQVAIQLAKRSRGLVGMNLGVTPV